MEDKDIGPAQDEFNKLGERFGLLYKRFLAIAMDYKYYVKSDIKDNEIYLLRDNVLYRFYSARFHFQLLLEYHAKVDRKLNEVFFRPVEPGATSNRELAALHERATNEIYSLFDSMVYHLCSIFDYMCRLINFSYDKEILTNPKWNVLIHKKNIEKNLYCSKDLIPKLQIIDKEFIYPLINHRSHLIHTEKDTGEFRMVYDESKSNLNAKFYATKLFKKNFPAIEAGSNEITIKYAALWLIDKTINTATEILFELSEDMAKNKKIPFGMFAYLADDRTIKSPSVIYWGDRNIT